MEDEEALKTGALVSQLANTVQHQVDNFLADGVVATRIVVGRIFLSGDQLFGVEQLSVCSRSDFICKTRERLNDLIPIQEVPRK